MKPPYTRFTVRLLIPFVLISSMYQTGVCQKQPLWQPVSIPVEILFHSGRGENITKPIIEGVLWGENSTRFIFSNVGVFESSKLRNKWRKVSFQYHPRLLGARFLSSQKGWAVGGEGDEKRVGVIYGFMGKTWSRLFKLPENGMSLFTDIYFVNDKKGWAVGLLEKDNPAGIVLTSDDGGKTWETPYYLRNEIDGFRVVKFFNKRSGVIISNHSILVSNDGGRNWHKKNGKSKELLFGMDIVSEREIWVVGARGLVLHSLDFGETWTETYLNSGSEKPWLSDVKFINKNQGWIVGQNGAIFSTNDGGHNWNLELSNTTSYLRGISISNKAVFTFGDDAVILRRALDKGLTNRK